MRLNILVDADIPAVLEYFSPFGQVRGMRGHQIGPADAAWADVVIVRSVTRIDRQLLGGSNVQFVGSATAGVDHVDENWLREAGITFAAAAGANASAVADYVLSALGVAAGMGAVENWPDVVVGIVGYGHVGRLLSARLERLGCQVLVSDPPQAATGHMDRASLQLEELLERVQVLSLHSSLTRTGNWSTAGMLDARRLARLPAGCALIQTSRGGVLDDRAVARMRQRGDLAFLALDVWEHEPVPDPDVVAAADLATPHIAGYSASAKRQGVEQIVRALELYLGLPAHGAIRAPDARRTLSGSMDWPGPAGAFSWLTRQLYNIRKDDNHFRETVMTGAFATDTSERFHALRAGYGTRPGFDAYRLHTDHSRWQALFDAVTLQ